MHISIEGFDGVGKSTASKGLAERLSYEFIEKPVHLLLPHAEAMNIYLTMSQRINKEESLEFQAQFYGLGNLWVSNKGETDNVVTDRHILSNLCWHFRDESQVYLEYLLGLLRTPDITFILLADEQSILRRMKRRNPHDKDIAFLKNAKEYQEKLRFFGEKYQQNPIYIDTSNKNEEEVLEELYAHVKGLLL